MSCPRALTAFTLLLALSSGGAGASGSLEAPPRFALSATSVTTNDSVSLRVERAPRLSQREVRLYLVHRAFAAAVRSRFDRRLSFIGSVRSTRHARTMFTVPPLETGSYALAYWCRGCLPRPNGIGVQASLAVRFDAPTGTGCPVTIPNGNKPRGASSSAWRFHGNGSLWALSPPSGVVQTNALGGAKLIWVARTWEGAPLVVQYRMLGEASSPFTTASVVSGTLGGYDGPSWASRMSFQPGCWQITARRLDVSVSYVAQVVVPNPDP